MHCIKYCCAITSSQLITCPSIWVDHRTLSWPCATYRYALCPIPKSRTCVFCGGTCNSAQTVSQSTVKKPCNRLPIAEEARTCNEFLIDEIHVILQRCIIRYRMHTLAISRTSLGDVDYRSCQTVNKPVVNDGVECSVQQIVFHILYRHLSKNRRCGLDIDDQNSSCCIASFSIDFFRAGLHC